MKYIMPLLVAFLSILLMACAWESFQIAISEQKNSKGQSIAMFATGVILILLSLVSICTAVDISRI